MLPGFRQWYFAHSRPKSSRLSGEAEIEAEVTRWNANFFRSLLYVQG
jgi:hypothetical protein